MHPAVELLAKRMDSNPDEFVPGHERHHRWERIIEKYVPHMTDEDKTIIRSKYDTLQLDQMHKEIMTELLYGEDPKQGLTLEKLQEVSKKLGVDGAVNAVQGKRIRLTRNMYNDLKEIMK